RESHIAGSPDNNFLQDGARQPLAPGRNQRARGEGGRSRGNGYGATRVSAIGSRAAAVCVTVT
ncbi:hypothetical protein chiPu_0024379, partial [Chiloscyllium punctatum]|nr:hypothetical protein [Chiloscyllium punctatum]